MIEDDHNDFISSWASQIALGTSDLSTKSIPADRYDGIFY